jgi:tRNA (guanine-N7-)-methyltransferase
MTTAPPEVWRYIFGNDRPVEVEIGPGRGDVLFTFAAQASHVNFYAVEVRSIQAEHLGDRARALGLRNVCIIAGDARCLITRLVPDASVSAYHVYFPDPWPKTRHRHRRLFQPGFADGLRRSLVPEGRVYVASDLPWLFADMDAHLRRAGFVADPAAPVRPRPVTRFERKYGRDGIHACAYRLGTAAPAAGQMPQNTS